jgi:SET domain-containing protein
MSDTWINLIIEMGVLALLGFLFYIFQRRRIVRFDIEEILESLENLTYDLNHFLEDNKTKSFYKELDTFCKKVELANENNSLPEMMDIFKDCSFSGMPKDLESKFQEIKTKLEFYTE